MATFLVTGGCGFIGSHLADTLLERGDSVRALDDLSTGLRANLAPGADLIEGDVADDGRVSRAMEGVDGVFHLAAVASVERGNQDWLGTHRTNLTGTITVLNAARQTGTPVVYASSAAVFGANGQMPLSEASETRPLSAYGADKLGCEHHAFAAGRVHGVRTCGLRFFNVYGPRQDPHSPYSGVISIFCHRMKAGEPVTIFGDGEQCRDFIYVSDVVRALMLAMVHASVDGPVFNVCTGRATTIRALAEAIATGLGVSPRIGFAPPRAGDIRASFGDPSRARRDLGFTAGIDLYKGLANTLNWI
ncbi:MAG: NAD-dependent epimerase/dehydratase family protein [Acetobacteraceae bacterium]|nr:NAD-dependent epimerase/dehydratase family protein [Acetobacteraceae bacterium]